MTSSSAPRVWPVLEILRPSRSGSFGGRLTAILLLPRFLNHTLWQRAKRGAYFLQRFNRGTFESSLKNADVSPVNTGPFSDLFLRDGEFLPLCTQYAANRCFEVFAHFGTG